MVTYLNVNKSTSYHCLRSYKTFKRRNVEILKNDSLVTLITSTLATNHNNLITYTCNKSKNIILTTFYRDTETIYRKYTVEVSRRYIHTSMMCCSTQGCIKGGHWLQQPNSGVPKYCDRKFAHESFCEHFVCFFLLLILFYHQNLK